MHTMYRYILFAAIVIANVCWLSPTLEAQSHTDAVQTETDATVATHDAHDSHDASEGHEGGHHGADVILFGKHFDATGQFFLKLTNFLIFACLIIWMLKGALSSAFKARTAEIESKLAQSEKDKAEGEAQLRELEAKMAGLQQELSGIMAKAESDAVAEKQRILEAAKAEAEQILAQTQAEIDYQKRLAETELRELVAQLAVEGAEARIRQQVQGDSVVRIMDQAIQQIGGAK